MDKSRVDFNNQTKNNRVRTKSANSTLNNNEAYLAATRQIEYQKKEKAKSFMNNSRSFDFSPAAAMHSIQSKSCQIQNKKINHHNNKNKTVMRAGNYDDGDSENESSEEINFTKQANF